MVVSMVYEQQTPTMASPRHEPQRGDMLLEDALEASAVLDIVIKDELLDDPVEDDVGGSVDDLVDEPADMLSPPTESQRPRRSATAVTPYSCVQCPAAFSSVHQYERHMESHDPGRGRQCHVCRKVLRGELCDFNRHVKRHARQKVLPCMYCDSKFTTMEYVRRHVYLMHNDEKPHRCPVCNKAFKFASRMRLHHMTHTGEKPEQCQQCGKTFRCLWSLECHVRTHTGERPYVCDQPGCDYAACDGSSLRHHTRMVHTKDKRLACPQCGKQFVKPSQVNMHVRMTHQREKNVACDICGKMFFNKGALSHHMGSHREDKPFKCALCPATFKTNNNMSTHVRTHTNTPDHECSICGKAFKFSAYLAKHLETHNETANFKCECGKRFKSTRCLQRHMPICRKLARERPFGCPHCPKRFSKKSSAAKHLGRFHTRVPSIWCLECGTEFRRVGTLVSHYAARHGDAGPFTCPDCGHQLREARQYARHRAEMHMTYITDGLRSASEERPPPTDGRRARTQKRRPHVDSASRSPSPDGGGDEPETTLTDRRLSNGRKHLQRGASGRTAATLADGPPQQEATLPRAGRRPPAARRKRK